MDLLGVVCGMRRPVGWPVQTGMCECPLRRIPVSSPGRGPPFLATPPHGVPVCCQYFGDGPQACPGAPPHKVATAEALELAPEPDSAVDG